MQKQTQRSHTSKATELVNSRAEPGLWIFWEFPSKSHRQQYLRYSFFALAPKHAHPPHCSVAITLSKTHMFTLTDSRTQPQGHTPMQSDRLAYSQSPAETLTDPGGKAPTSTLRSPWWLSLFPRGQVSHLNPDSIQSVCWGLSLGLRVAGRQVSGPRSSPSISLPATCGSSPGPRGCLCILEGNPPRAE